MMMANILDGNGAGFPGSGLPLGSSPDTGTPNKITRRLKVIKAEEARFRGIGDGTRNSGQCSGEPQVKPMMNANTNLVEGLEIFCRCGEKLIIRFDVEDHEKFN
jgi:hypothetical protein